MNLLPQGVFADKLPEICSTPSPTMATYMHLQRDMIDLMAQGTLSPEMYNPSSNGFGPYSQKLITLQTGQKVLQYSGTILQNLVTNMKGQAGEIFETTAVIGLMVSLVSLSIVDSSVSLFTLLAMDEPIVRDRRSLLHSESEIFDTIYDLSKNKKINLLNKFDRDAFQKVANVLGIYVNNHLITLSQKSSQDPQMSYASISQGLMRMNVAMKHFLSYGTTNVLQKEFSFGDLVVRFTDTAIENLRAEYAEVRFWLSCNAALQNIKENLSSSWSNNVVGGRNESLDIIKESTKQLKTALVWAFTFPTRKDQEKRFTEEEINQLRSIYGIDVMSLTENKKNRWAEHFNFSRTIASMKDLGKQVSESFSSWDWNDWWNGWWNGGSWWDKKWVSACTDKKSCKNLLVSAELDKLCSLQEIPYEYTEICIKYKNNPVFSKTIDQLRALWKKTSDLQKKEIEKLNTLEVSRDLSLIYTMIDRVETIKNTIGKKGESDTLIDVLGTVCEKQCANKWNKGCWASKQNLVSVIIH